MPRKSTVNWEDVDFSKPVSQIADEVGLSIPIVCVAKKRLGIHNTSAVMVKMMKLVCQRYQKLW